MSAFDKPTEKEKRYFAKRLSNGKEGTYQLIYCNDIICTGTKALCYAVLNKKIKSENFVKSGFQIKLITN